MSKEIVVLIVDDEKPIRDLIVSFLTRDSYLCFTAEDSAGAKEILAEGKVDLLISDINMPGESGIELIRWVKKEYSDVGIVVATALGNPIEAETVLKEGVYGYIVKPFNKNMVLITVDNALRIRKMELEEKQQKKELESQLQTLFDNLPVGIGLIDEKMSFLKFNRKIAEWFPQVSDTTNLDSLLRESVDKGAEQLPQSFRPDFLEHRPCISTFRLQSAYGDREFNIVLYPLVEEQRTGGRAVIMVEDLTEKLQMERELLQAQKLETIGQLAAGIAHEINTPIQFVGDNIQFLGDAFADLKELFNHLSNEIGILPDNKVNSSLKQRFTEAREAADLDFLFEEIPKTITQSLEGTGRVASIVRAMREFSHPGESEKVPTDINRVVESTIIVSRNEWKYVAEITTDLAAGLPVVPCLPGELNQVLVNLIVNSAHAIEQRVEAGEYEKGTIRLSTEYTHDSVVVRVADNGGGIPEKIRERVFEPFFTTKLIGKGTGQGLAIARSIIVDKHSGTIDFQVEKGIGTTFLISLPINS